MAKPSFITAISPDYIRWVLDANYLELIQNFVLSQICQEGQLIKKAPARAVFFFDWQGEEFVLKIFRAPSLWDRLRSRFRSKASLEWKQLLALKNLDLPVPQAIAVGKQGVESYLVSKKLPAVRPLKEVVFAPLTFADRRHIAIELARLVACLHNHRIIHHDFHFGNLMYGQDRALYLLDLHEVEQCRIMTRRDCLKNLAMLGSSFTMCAQSSDYLTFLHHYQPLSHQLNTVPWPKLLAWSSVFLHEYRLAFWQKRAERCLIPGKYFAKLRFTYLPQAWDRTRQFLLPQWGVATGICHEGDTVTPQLFAQLPKYLVESEILKVSRSTQVGKTPFGVLKEYRRKKWRNLVIDCFRKSRACRAWLKGYDCLNRAIPTARPLGFVDYCLGPLLLRSYLLVEEIPQAQTLTTYLQGLGKQPVGRALAQKQQVLAEVGKIVKLLHLRGMAHRDLKATNFLVSGNKLYLIDLDGLSVPWRLTPAIKRKNFARLLQGLRTIPGVTTDDLELIALAYQPDDNNLF